MVEPSQQPSRRGPAPWLQQQEILAAVLRILDRDGIARFNMRALSAELGVSPMTVYNYVPNKAHLLEAAVDYVIDSITPPDPQAQPWEPELRRYAVEAWHTQLPHAWLPTMLAEQRVLDRPAQVTARRALVDLFKAAGADEAAVREAVAVFFAFMIGNFVQVVAAPTRASTARANAMFLAGLDIVIDGLRARFRRTG